MPNIRETFEVLVTDLEALLATTDKIQEERTALEQFDAALRSRERKQDERDVKHKEALDQLEREKQFIKTQLEEIAKKELVIKKIDEKKEELIDLEKRTNERIQVNRELIETLDDKLKAIDQLKEREEEVALQEKKAERESIADRERKQALDEKEKALEAERTRLQKIAARYG